MRLALVGYGKIAPKHLEVFRDLGAEFVASCNRSEEGRKKAQSEGRIPQTYSSIEEMLDRSRPDGVLVAATFSQMYSAAKAVLPFKIPTLLEKPPGTSLREFDELVRLAGDTPVMIGLNRRFYSVLERAFADAGGKNKVTGAFIEWSEDPVHVLKRATKEEVARWTFGNSLHGLDLLTTIAGAIPQPVIHARNLGEPFRWITALQGVSDRGVIATFNSTWDSPGKWRVSFTAKERRYVFAPLETCTVLERGKDDRTIEPSEEDRRFKPGFHGQARAFLRAIEHKVVAPEHTLASARPAMVLAEALTGAVQHQS